MTGDLTWTCHVCRFPIDGDTGYMSAADEAIAGAGPVTWLAQHDACRHQEFSYWIAISTISTVEQAASWTEHLAGKNWFDRSDWMHLMFGQGLDLTARTR